MYMYNANVPNKHCDIFMCEWKMNLNLSYLNVIQMLKVHKA